MSLTFSVIKGTDVTQVQLEACTKLFNENYGIWGPHASQISSYLKAGVHVKFSVEKLKKQCLGDAEHSILSLCTSEGVLVGHAFGTYWKFGPDTVCWITQLVVRTDHRRKGIASSLLRFIRTSENHFNAIGIASSHPGACMALLASTSRSIKQVDLNFIRDNARNILETTPVNYLRTAQLVGTAFDPTSTSNAVSSVLTDFYVDHTEPLQVLAEVRVRYSNAWPLGELLEGHEFLLVVQLR